MADSDKPFYDVEANLQVTFKQPPQSETHVSKIDGIDAFGGRRVQLEKDKEVTLKDAFKVPAEKVRLLVIRIDPVSVTGTDGKVTWTTKIKVGKETHDITQAELVYAAQVGLKLDALAEITLTANTDQPKPVASVSYALGS